MKRDRKKETDERSSRPAGRAAEKRRTSMNMAPCGTFVGTNGTPTWRMHSVVCTSPCAQSGGQNGFHVGSALSFASMRVRF